MAKEKTTIKPKEVTAYARYIHVSPQKLRLVSALLKKAPIDIALEQLKFSSKSAALPLKKVINSAVANALHNYDIKPDNLFIKSITIDSGPMFKRYQPRAQGRAFMVRKRTSHINVILEEKARKTKSKRTILQAIRPTVVKDTDKRAKPKEQEAAEKETKTEQIAKQPKLTSKPESKVRKKFTDFRKRFFNRKSSTS
jgi:large subunit ribosomal protein L22